LPLGPTGKTDISDSLGKAITELTGADHRSGAKRAIVLFTDGVPNMPSSSSQPDFGAFAQATTAGGQGIPIYTIGLSQVVGIQSHEAQVLGDGQETGVNYPLGSTGVAAISGNGAIYIAVTNNADLQAAFQTVARTLVVLQ
jgi:hypothetical protein